MYGEIVLCPNHNPARVFPQGQTLFFAINSPLATMNCFLLCPFTKQFTATLILQLMQDGKLSLDDPISKHRRTFDIWLY